MKQTVEMAGFGSPVAVSVETRLGFRGEPAIQITDDDDPTNCFVLERSKENLDKLIEALQRAKETPI